MKRFLQNISALFRETDWVMLLFLLGVTADMILVKAASLALMGGALAFNRRRGSRQPVPPFYWLIPLLIVVQAIVLPQSHNAGFRTAALVASCFWGVSVAVFFLLARRTTYRAGIATLNTWFTLNTTVSIFQLAAVMIAAGSLNPYKLDDPAFGNSTGDWVKGILLAPCYVNAFICSFFTFFFLRRGQYRLALIATVILCLTSSNFVNAVFLAVLWITLLFNRRLWKPVLLHTLVFVLFYGFVGSNNLAYAIESVWSGSDARKAKAKRLEMRHYNPEFDTVIAQPFGKMVALKQTASFMASSTRHLLLGAGPGGFSSQLALRLTDGRVPPGSRAFRKLPRYTSDAFRQNHLRLFEIVYSMPPEFHSIRHLPGSFVNQIAGEYGLAGIIIFLAGYAAYFFRRWKTLSFTRPMLFLAFAFLGFDYGFEYLSVMVFLELFFLVDRARAHETPTA